ncbi:MAG: IS66 family transposase [Pseudomonadota bacterium]
MPDNATISLEELNALVAERDSLRDALRVATTERDLALERLKAFTRQLFAAKSEVRGSGQKDLFLNEAEALAPTAATSPAEEVIPGIAVAAHKRKKRGRKPLDPALPREVVRHELPASERVCSHDGHVLIEIGVAVSEQLDVIPEQVRVIQHQRVKYACPCCDLGIKVTPVVPRIIPRGLLTESAFAWIITGKYQYGLPLYRQAALLSRFGGDLSRNTLAAGVVHIGKAVQPMINLLRDFLLDADVVYGDETTIQVLKEPGRKPQTKSYMWVQMNGAGPPVRLFTYASGRGAQYADKLYAGIKAGAALITDGYEVYNGIAKSHQLVHLGCWSHARRLFIKAEDAIPKKARGPHQLATQFIRAIAKLYAAETRSKDWNAMKRQRLRARYSKPVLAHIEKLLLTHLPNVIPESLLGKALTYLKGQWPKLIRYVDNGHWPISNNACENAIRPFVVGRKGWLFADTIGGANASANLYSLIETAKANGIEPYRYLKWLFTLLPLAKTVDDFTALLPWNIPASEC